MNLFPLYIDPGTGSALFSITIGIVAVSYFLVRNIFLKLKIFIFHRNTTLQKTQKYVIYAEDKRYWVFFKLILEEFEQRQIEVLYLTQSTDDPVFSSGFIHIKGKYIGKGNKAFAYLNFLSADVVLATTPDLDVLQWKRSKTVKHYCHILHAASGSVLYRLFGLDYYDSILLPCTDEIQEIRYLENTRALSEKQIVVVGNTYLDTCIEKLNEIPVEKDHIFTVLVSPSWGASSLLKIFGEKLLDPLVKTGWRIIVRPHPQSVNSEYSMLNSLIKRYKNTPNIEWDYNYENIYSLSKADVMISDFSGIIYDYAFLFGRPVLLSIRGLDLRPYDAYCLNDEPAYLHSLKKLGPELDESNINSIKDIILGISQDAEFQNGRMEAKEQMWQYHGESGKRVVDFLTGIKAELA